MDGMTEALIANLAKISAPKVISRTSVMRYKGVKKPLTEIADELRVDAVVEGSVLQIGYEIRITAQLIEAATDRYLWAESYDRALTNILSLQRGNRSRYSIRNPGQAYHCRRNSPYDPCSCRSGGPSIV